MTFSVRWIFRSSCVVSASFSGDSFLFIIASNIDVMVQLNWNRLDFFMVLEDTDTFCDGTTSTSCFCSLDSAWTVSDGGVEKEGCVDGSGCDGDGSGEEGVEGGGILGRCSIGSSIVWALLSHSESERVGMGLSSEAEDAENDTSLWLSVSISRKTINASRVFLASRRHIHRECIINYIPGQTHLTYNSRTFW